MYEVYRLTEVQNTFVKHPSLFGPDPVRDNWIDECCQHGTVDKIGFKFASLGNGPTHDRSRSTGENVVEEPNNEISCIVQSIEPVSDERIAATSVPIEKVER